MPLKAVLVALVLHVIVFIGLPYSKSTPPQALDSVVQLRITAPAIVPMQGEPQTTFIPTIPKPAAPQAVEPEPAIAPTPPPPDAQPTKSPVQEVIRPSPTNRRKTQPSATQLVSNALDMVRSSTLSADIDPAFPPPDDGLRHKHITRATRELRFANYMDAWVKKVERVGNLHYPLEIRRRKLSGHLTLDVAIRRDGSVASIDILTPSKHPELDRAAVDIVRLGAPYAPLPADIRADTDLLHITRVWRFTSRDQWGSE